ncbi:hypothetical protein BRARA_A02994 [Brassica rapa]|uniref:Zinc knuckle CX2CX4HX4C domain-containing protein n=1 Tax=Brassica campestris TaxID=3711 RepID=A0A398AXW7_BRACM|nr:hypothetical protein BRARA_A02994 [Brassica rapa]
MILRYWDPGIREEESLMGRLESEIGIGDDKDQIFALISLAMTQSQLLGNAGEVKNGEGTRKRLKISVPHFDNSALIKTFSKTLIGRCMNPEEQEMKALISNLPKIWKLEERITFWVRVIGVPVEFKTVPTFESIGETIGRAVAVDLDHSRVQVVVDAFKELCFETTVDFTGGEFYDGEEVLVSLRYEKLFGYCQVCGSLCHKDEVCSLDMKNTKKSPEKKQEGRDGSGAWYDGGKYDDRARSYKGVVINGNANQRNKEREGRSIMAREQQLQRDVREEVRELDKAQADGTEVILDPIDADQGLAAVLGMQEDQVDLDDEDVMDMDEIKAHLLENGIDMDVEDFLEKLLEEEIEEVVKGQEEEQGPPGGDVVKKQGLRKRLFKPTISTAGSTKMRVFNALASPRKQAAAKTGARQGDNSKQTKSKGTSNPKLGH